MKFEHCFDGKFISPHFRDFKSKITAHRFHKLLGRPFMHAVYNRRDRKGFLQELFISMLFFGAEGRILHYRISFSIKKAEVMRKLLAKAIKDWKIKKALELLKERKATLRKAAKLADVSYAEMLDLSSKADIEIGYSLRDLSKDLA